MTFLSLTFSNQQERFIGIAAILVLLLLIGLTVTHDFNLWQDIHGVAATEGPPQVITASSTDKISKIPSWHLFGGSDDQNALPGTRLQAVLSGVMMAQPTRDSEAIISVAGEAAKVYRVGDELNGVHVTVHAITNDGVILDNGGRLEKLTLERPPLEFHGLPTSGS